MVPADSRRIPRVPRYSGYGYSSVVVRVRGCHPLRPLFPKRSAPTDWRYRRPTTPDVRKHTTGLGCSPFARHYWGNHCYFLFLEVLRCFSSLRLPPYTYIGIATLQVAGLSHSEIAGSEVICTYPALIAAYHVLHRLREPRHPPSALYYFLLAIVHTFSSCTHMLNTYINTYKHARHGQLD